MVTKGQRKIRNVSGSDWTPQVAVRTVLTASILICLRLKGMDTERPDPGVNTRPCRALGVHSPRVTNLDLGHTVTPLHHFHQAGPPCIQHVHHANKIPSEFSATRTSSSPQNSEKHDNTTMPILLCRTRYLMEQNKLAATSKIQRHGPATGESTVKYHLVCL